ncbi:MAG: peptidase C1, partial [Phycisphaerae bacterium]|nr:peptidase C1 [Phycisphaerae bacterium]
MMSRSLGILTVTLMLAAGGHAIGQSMAPDRDRAVFVDDTDHVKEELMRRAGTPTEETASKPPVLKAVLAPRAIPTSPAVFRQAWHEKPISQDLTGQCWAFASTSFFESEIHRRSGRAIKLSEMYTVYWEFVDKARHFVATQGRSRFTRGSEADATIRVWHRYGIVPAAAYPGRPVGRDFFDDRLAFAEMLSALKETRERADWNEERVVADIRTILDRHFGPPPTRVEVDGQSLTPLEYLRDVVQLDLTGYVTLISLLQEPEYAFTALPVPDNWWNSQDYFNVPLADFVRVLRAATEAGPSLCCTIDRTEPGFLPRQDIAVIPTFDIASSSIDDAARQLRFSNGSTTDDHLVHCVGFYEGDGHRWYLIKDSETQPRNGHHGGYM